MQDFCQEEANVDVSNCDILLEFPYSDVCIDPRP